MALPKKVAKIIVQRDSGTPNGYRFSYTNENGKAFGQVSIRRPGGPDQRTGAEKLEAAKAKIKALIADLYSTSNPPPSEKMAKNIQSFGRG